jgi:Holliday junction resolvase RusA-like endonuclease
MAAALFELLIDGPPVSQQARWRSRVRDYKAEVRRLAAAAYGMQAPYSGTARVEITILFELAAGDVDNFAKPILDALKGVVLADDGQVMDLLLRKRPFGVIPFTEPSAAVLDRLDARREFVHLIVLPLVL